jgi:hypothetical protein
LYVYPEKVDESSLWAEGSMIHADMDLYKLSDDNFLINRATTYLLVATLKTKKIRR